LHGIQLPVIIKQVSSIAYQPNGNLISSHLAELRPMERYGILTLSSEGGAAMETKHVIIQEDRNMMVMNIPTSALSVDSYLERYKEDCADYLRRLCQGKLINCMIAWNSEEAFRWSGPWQGNHVLCSVDDARCRSPYTLKTAQETVDFLRRMEEHSAFLFPSRLTKILHKDKPSQIDKISDEDMAWLLQAMSLDERKTREQKLETCFAKIERERYSHPSSDYPYRVYLCGTDDTSYSRCYASEHEAMNAIQSLAHTPTFENLEALGLMFTN
jgi:hypothetical protein